MGPIYQHEFLYICKIDLEVENTSQHRMYVLAGWEGSTHDSFVLQDALSCPTGLQFPEGISQVLQYTLLWLKIA
jgi:hypothetical protein